MLFLERCLTAVPVLMLESLEVHLYKFTSLFIKSLFRKYNVTPFSVFIYSKTTKHSITKEKKKLLILVMNKISFI